MDAAGSPHRISVGTIIDDRYEVVSQLGAGGFATVYRARQRHIDRPVAVKVLSVALQLRDDATFERRFMREAQLVAQINHPNVVTIYDFGFTGALRQPYIAMELLEGDDLDVELGREGRLRARRALPLIIGALDALAVGHASGIVHKDLKPANLHLSRASDGREILKVLDFGIARTADSEEATRFTATGQFMGTPQYAAPEYLERQEVSPALDVYQMGLILVEVLTGRRVVDADSPIACMMAHSAGRLEVPSALLDTPLGPVLLTALAHDPAQRYVDAGAMRDALRSIDAAVLDASLAHADFGQLVAPHAAVTGDAPTLARDTGAFQQPGGMRNTAPPHAAPLEHGRPRALPILIAIGGLAALAIVVMVVIILAGSGEPASQASPDTDTPPVAETPPPTEATEPAPAAAVAEAPLTPQPPVAEVVAEAVAEPVDTPPPPAPEVTAVTVAVTSDPAGATVEVDGETLGQTPLDIPVEGEAARRVVLTLDGYRDLEFELTADMASDGVVTHKLRKKRRRRSRRDDGDDESSGSGTASGGTKDPDSSGGSGMTLLP